MTLNSQCKLCNLIQLDKQLWIDVHNKVLRDDIAQSQVCIWLNDAVNESFKQRDTARAQVNDLSAEVVKMTEEIRQLRGMIP